jgi:Ca2+-binding RTX toxin-like protein
VAWGATTALSLSGNELHNIVYGNAGDNTLNGGGGADILIGFGGNDNYYVDNAGDVVLEAAGAGNDAIFSSVSYTLGAGVEAEVLSTVSFGGTTAINLTGNELHNIVYGNAGDNVLNGGGGADVLIGFAGNDSYFVDNAGDVVAEGAGAGGDTVFASVSYALSAGSEVEVLSVVSFGDTAAINLTGNEYNNIIYGNAGANVLDGKGGNDLLIGQAGADTYSFTTALGAGNVDTAVGFEHGVDKFALDDAVFTQVGGLGTLNASAFVTGSAAGDADDRIIYNSATGQLFYDADGNGAGAQVQFANLLGHPLLGVSDLIVI